MYNTNATDRPFAAFKRCQQILDHGVEAGAARVMQRGFRIIRPKQHAGPGTPPAARQTMNQTGSDDQDGKHRRLRRYRQPIIAAENGRQASFWMVSVDMCAPDGRVLLY